MKRKIALISDSRCSHSLYIPVLDALANSPDFEYRYILAGMHLSEKFGKTIEEVKAQGYRPAYAFPLLVEGTRESQVRNIAESIHRLTEIFVHDRPDIILAQGDRGITLAAALVGNHLRLPVAHMYGGEISRTVDEPVRHASTRLAHLHLAATKKIADRLRKTGEEEFRIHLVGAIGVEYIKRLAINTNANTNVNTNAALLRTYHLAADEPFLVVLQHPVSGEENQAGRQMEETLNAVAGTQLKVMIIYPNSDPGHQEMVEVLERKAQMFPDKFLVRKNIPYGDYLTILKASSGLIGNSSGGIMETPSLGTPTINVGTRQEGRERAGNVLDTDHDEGEIKRALEKALADADFKQQVNLKRTPYDPYGDGNTSARILKVLREIKVDDKLLTKRLAY